MGGVWVRVWTYLMVLAAGLAFSVVFTGEGTGSASYDSSGRAFGIMLGATLVAMAVGSAGKYRFVLIPPATVLYTMFVVYGFPPVTLSGWRSLFLEIGADIYEAGNVMYLEPVPYDLFPGLLLLMIPLVMVLAAFSTSMTLYERSPVVSVVVLGVTRCDHQHLQLRDGDRTVLPRLSRLRRRPAAQGRLRGFRGVRWTRTPGRYRRGRAGLPGADAAPTAVLGSYGDAGAHRLDQLRQLGKPPGSTCRPTWEIT